jgi:hypothetical protein
MAGLAGFATHVLGGKRLMPNKAHRPFLHFKLRYVRDVAGQSGKAVAFMPSLELVGDAAGKQGATAFQGRRQGALTEHQSVGAAELRAVELTPRAIGGASVSLAQNLNPNPIDHLSPAILLL